MRSKKYFTILAMVGTLAFFPAVCAAFPDGPIKFVVGAAPGGGTDMVTRQIASSMAKELGQPVLVSNLPGGGGSTALMNLKNAAPDGHTLAVTPSTAFSYQPLVSNQYAMSDFIPLATLVTGQDAFIVRGDAPWKSFMEMLEDAKKNGKTLLYASQLPVDKMILSYIAMESGASIAAVPTKGGGEMVPKLLGGHVDMAYSVGMHMQYLPSGEMRVLAAMTTERQKSAPDAPTLKELGWDIAMDTIFLVTLPAGTPDDVVEKLSAAIRNATETPELIDLVDNKLTMLLTFNNPADTKALMEDQSASYARLIEALK